MGCEQNGTPKLNVENATNESDGTVTNSIFFNIRCNIQNKYIFADVRARTIRPFFTTYLHAFTGLAPRRSPLYFSNNSDFLKQNIKDEAMHNSIHHVKKIFFEIEHLKRTKKHISDPYKGSAAKRINMFLRWMVRKDDKGVDFGIWKSINPKFLSCPLDIHSGNIARKLGILNRKQNDHKAVLELDKYLRKLDVFDPAKYDFALFGIGVNEKL